MAGDTSVLRKAAMPTFAILKTSGVIIRPFMREYIHSSVPRKDVNTRSKGSNERII